MIKIMPEKLSIMGNYSPIALLTIGLFHDFYAINQCTKI